MTSYNVDFPPNLVHETMRKASLSLASGPDAIPSYFCSRLASAFSLSVSVLFTASSHFSILHSDCKPAIVQFLFKKSDPSIVSLLQGNFSYFIIM